MQITRSYNTTTFIYWKNKVLVPVVVVVSKISIHYYNIVYPMMCVIKFLAFD
jgi:hypothetical protein